MQVFFQEIQEGYCSKKDSYRKTIKKPFQRSVGWFTVAYYFQQPLHFCYLQRKRMQWQKVFGPLLASSLFTFKQLRKAYNQKRQRGLRLIRKVTKGKKNRTIYPCGNERLTRHRNELQPFLFFSYKLWRCQIEQQTNQCTICLPLKIILEMNHITDLHCFDRCWPHLVILADLFINFLAYLFAILVIFCYYGMFCCCFFTFWQF